MSAGSGNGREGKGRASAVMWRNVMENEERMKTENGRRTDGLCLYVKKKTFLGQNTKSYFYVKMTYVFMFLCFWECSIIGIKFIRPIVAKNNSLTVLFAYFKY